MSLLISYLPLSIHFSIEMSMKVMFFLNKWKKMSTGIWKYRIYMYVYVIKTLIEIDLKN